MNVLTSVSLRRIATAPIGFVLATSALAGFTNPHTPAYRGAPHTEYSGWESFTSAYLGSNAPDDPASTSNDALIQQTTPGAFLTGGNIYSFNSLLTFELSDTVPGDVQEVALQISTKGNELDYQNVRLRFVDDLGNAHVLPFDSYTQLAYTPSIGVDVESLFEWDLSTIAANVTSYQLLFDTSTPSVSFDAVLLDVRWSAPPSIYCTAQVNSQGCTPAIGFSGTPSASSGNGFAITAAQVLDHKAGVFFYGTNGAASLPFGGGTMCVNSPRRRTAVQDSAGTSGCTGLYSFDFNAWIGSGADASLIAGTHVWGQYWSRDPGSSSSPTNLSDAIDFVIGQ